MLAANCERHLQRLSKEWRPRGCGTILHTAGAMLAAEQAGVQLGHKQFGDTRSNTRQCFQRVVTNIHRCCQRGLTPTGPCCTFKCHICSRSSSIQQYNINGTDKLKCHALGNGKDAITGDAFENTMLVVVECLAVVAVGPSATSAPGQPSGKLVKK